MARRKKPSAVEAWCEKLFVVYEAAQGIVKSHKEQDIRLAYRIINEAMMDAGLYDMGKELIVVQVDEYEPECVACGADTSERGGHLLYCSDECRDFAGIVRYIRGTIQKGEAFDADQLKGIGQHVHPWVSTGETYKRRVPRAVRLAVLERDGHKCQTCGEPATDIDHKSGDSYDMENLQALCSECNRQKMLSCLVPITDADQKRDWDWRVGHIAEYVANPIAPGIAFEPEGWDDKRKELTLYRKAKLRVARTHHP